MADSKTQTTKKPRMKDALKLTELKCEAAASMKILCQRDPVNATPVLNYIHALEMKVRNA